MNKLFIALAVFGLFAFAAPTFAATPTCGNPTLNRPASQVFDPITVSTTTISAINNVNCDGGIPDNVVSAWGTNKDVPHLMAGATTVDEGGISYACPAFYTQKCVDITHTNYYRVQMAQLGRQLKDLGVFGGMFNYWINYAK